MTIRRSSRLLAVGTAALAATVLLTGCNDDAGSAAAPASTAAGGTTTGTTGGAAGAGGKATGPAGSAPAGARCHADELKAAVQLQGPGSAMVILTNKGSRSCTVYGYPGYGGLLADNSPVEVAVKREPYPGQPVLSTLKPGTSAFAGLKWAVCEKSDPKCKVLAGVRLTPPDETTALTAEVLGLDGKPVAQLPVSAAGFTTGTLQPSNQGVVFTTS
ncbi:DUF4232 domain-containing protein [Kitasatospora sp. NPDC097643]|uniref:DUF4232 domain-containing protein n=1 Tax=Kitasatospora sp. NPDC097643 TaxID=3157230 RepID=UPI003316CCD2